MSRFVHNHGKSEILKKLQAARALEDDAQVAVLTCSLVRHFRGIQFEKFRLKLFAVERLPNAFLDPAAARSFAVSIVH